MSSTVADTATLSATTVPLNTSGAACLTLDVSASSDIASAATSYSTMQVAALAVLTAAFCALALFGNVSVMVVIWRDRVISRHTQNRYLLSMAAADAGLVVLVVPFSLANELLGAWPFGSVYCRIYLSVDIMLCTASIWNICAIGVDRFVAVKYPVTFRRFRTVARVRIGILSIWLIAAAVSLLPFMGETETVSTNRRCYINNSTWYIILSSSLSFFIPTLIIWPIYIKIYAVGRRLHTGRRSRQINSLDFNELKKLNSRAEMARTRNNSCDSCAAAQSPMLQQRLKGQLAYASTKDSKTRDGNGVPQLLITAAQEKERRGGLLEPPRRSSRKLSLREQFLKPPALIARLGSGAGDALTSRKDETIKATGARIEDNSPPHNKSHAAELDAVGGKCSCVTPPFFCLGSCCCCCCCCETRRRHPCDHAQPPPPAARLLSATSMTSISSRKSGEQGCLTRREKRFVFIISIVTGCFMLCWTPFFSTYLLYAVCGKACCINADAFKVFFWLGYMNSALNPVLYTIFNKDLRLALQRLYGINSSRRTS